MKSCPLYNQHKFTVQCSNKPCFQHCCHNHCHTTVVKHEHEHIHHTECEHMKKCDIPHDINVNISRTFSVDKSKLDTIHKYNKICFTNLDDAYESIKEASLKPGEEYIVYYRDKNSISGISSAMAVGNLNSEEEPIIYIDKNYVDNIITSFILNEQDLLQKITTLENELKTIKEKIDKIEGNNTDIQEP